MRKLTVATMLTSCLILGIAATNPPEEHAFKNLKILPKSTTHEEMEQIMGNFKNALGVHCDFCHAPSKDSSVHHPDFASDEKPEKNIAREMMRMTHKINKKYFADALKFGLPLIPYSFTGWILLSMDRIFINNMLGLDQTGLYSVAYQVCMIITLIQISFNTAWVPWLYTKIKKDDPLLNIKIVKFSYGFVLFNFLLAAMLALAGPAFFKLFLGKNFYQATNFIWWLSLAQAANAIHIVAVTYLNYHNKNIYLTYSAIFTALIHIPIIYWLIKANGTIGAAQALFISNLITSFMTFFFAFKFHKMPWLFWLKSRTER